MTESAINVGQWVDTHLKGDLEGLIAHLTRYLEIIYELDRSAFRDKALQREAHHHVHALMSPPWELTEADIDEIYDNSEAFRAYLIGRTISRPSHDASETAA
ncbi:hypothetical protein KBC99_00440 [Candidatus Saccharibacteria bacterium]|nr:hypothetical protein [Candidatus Saccharibacteria bacterium]